MNSFRLDSRLSRRLDTAAICSTPYSAMAMRDLVKALLASPLRGDIEIIDIADDQIDVEDRTTVLIHFNGLVFDLSLEHIDYVGIQMIDAPHR